MLSRTLFNGSRQAVRLVKSAGQRAYSSAGAAGPAASGARTSGLTMGALSVVGAGSAWYYQSQSAPLGTPLYNDSRTPAAGIKGTSQERTFIAVKPDGVQRALVGDIIKRFEARGYKLVGLKLTVPSKSLAEKHYADLRTKPFFNGLVDYMTNGKAPVVAMVWEGKDVIRQGRRMLGATNPLEAAPGTIRADYCTSIGRNIIHGSDSFESALTEITLWFNENELADWTPSNAEWVTADN
ncbi:nucleoside diphosphate kinase Ndk1 [Tieghemiomyces parasiticus]|uniref:Nucleoside diphosphate kinase n=1 Tax=Tieghemiomyces parasiticus TaxID=78921 RepID=A0A9W8AHI6_9FUNG|nr:nucleoside diphosphate kinase Ndk1 [Tieghemiomyces parasiticus]